MKTIRQYDDDLDIDRLIRVGSSAWTGPSPLTPQSRWAAAAQQKRKPGHALKLAAAGLAFTALTFGSVVFIAALATPDGHATMVNLMSHVFSSSGGTAPSPSEPSPSPANASPAPGAVLGAPSPSPGQRTNPASAPREREPWQEGPSPGPSHLPSPRPSESPDT
jgi:hypothetical protein